MEKEDERKPGQKQPEGERKFDQEQYDLLKHCSEMKNITEWNKWRERNPYQEILLEGADLYNCYLKGAFLNKAVVIDRHERIYFFKEEIDPKDKIASSLFRKMYEKCGEVHLENANLRRAHLEGALLYEARLFCADINDTYLEQAEFWRTNIKGASLHTAIVDGSTLFWRCQVNHGTDFRGVALGNLRIDPGTKQLLEYNIRRINWEEWYRGKSKNKWIIKMHKLLKCPVRLFWCVSNYGLSTWRIILTFLALAFVFAVIYWLWPRCVLVNGIVGDIKGFVHALYFSVVTMTTLGFGDIAANPDSWKGQVLLMVQVILGYVMLGALVTRFAVLFTAGGPAGKFSPRKIKKTGDG